MDHGTLIAAVAALTCAEAEAQTSGTSNIHNDEHRLLTSRQELLLGMTATYRLQFLNDSTAHEATGLIETTVAGSVDAAIRYAAEAEWPPDATALRLVDLDGRLVYEQTRADRR
jgi:hypothetical protein